MMSAEHRRPLAAFFVVFTLACLIMANGLRTQVGQVLIGAGAPREVVSAIAPDMVLGQSLRNVPAPVRSKVSADRAAASAPVQQVVVAPAPRAASVLTPASTVSVGRPARKPPVTKPVTRPRSHHPAPKPAPVTTPSPEPTPAEGVVTTPSTPTRPAFAAPGKGYVGGPVVAGQKDHRTHPVRHQHRKPLASPAKTRGHHHVITPPRRANQAPAKTRGHHHVITPPRRANQAPAKTRGHHHVITPPRRANQAPAKTRSHPVRQQARGHRGPPSHDRAATSHRGNKSKKADKADEADKAGTSDHKRGRGHDDRGGRHSGHHR